MEMLTSALLPAALRKSTATAPHTWQDPCCEQIGVADLRVNDWSGSFTVPVNARLLPTSFPCAVLPTCTTLICVEGKTPTPAAAALQARPLCELSDGLGVPAPGVALTLHNPETRKLSPPPPPPPQPSVASSS